MRKQQTTKPAYQDLILLSLFAAIIFVLAFTPIGMINLGFIKATILHLPVILGSVILGPKLGAVLGGCFGLASLISNTTAPTLLSFAFSPLMPVPGLGRGSPLALVVCFVPRILVGILPGMLYRACTTLPALREGKAKKALLAVVGVSGSLINTVLVMGMIYFFFKDAYAGIKGVSTDALLGVLVAGVALQSTLEAALAGVLTLFVCPPLFRFHPEKHPPREPRKQQKQIETTEAQDDTDH